MAAVTSGAVTSLLVHSIKPQHLGSRTSSVTTCQFRHTILSSYVSRSSFHSIELRNRPNLPQQKTTPLYPYTSCRQSTPVQSSTSLRVADRGPLTVCQGQSRGLSGLGGFGSSGKGGDAGKASNLPPSFRTGSKWEVPARPSNSTTTAPTSLLKRPIAPTPRTWETLKEPLESNPVPAEDSQANIELNLKKLKAISSGTHRDILICY